MSDAIISRRGGNVLQQAIAPTITKVSETATSITFTLTNNDAASAVILWEVGDTTPDANSIELATGATSGNLTISGLTRTSALTLYATANVTGKVKSNVAEVVYDAIIFIVATGGTTLEYDLDSKRYKSHTFTSNGTFEVTTIGNGDRNELDYLIIAGGASGGVFTQGGGGGGAGGYRTTLGDQGGLGTLDTKINPTVTTYAVTIGAGGTSASPNVTDGNDGSPTSVAFSTTITSIGGGAGGGQNAGANGFPGGSGGGVAGNNATPPVPTGGAGTANQGFAGGSSSSSDTTLNRGSGGGGAGQIGQTNDSTLAKGGNGLANILRTGSAETRAGGGGGSGAFGGSGATGGLGGGGHGDTFGANSFSGAINTGSGGGGGSAAAVASGAGGSGIVVIRYEVATSV